MLILLTAINAKFIHSSPSVYSLAQYCQKDGRCNDNIKIREFTINHRKDFIISEIFKVHPDVLAFSCYIWNIQYVKQICAVIRKILPDTKIVLGGPEVSFDYERYLEKSLADIVVVGEGEATFSKLVEHFTYGNIALNDIGGIAFCQDGAIHFRKGDVPQADDIPFIYENKLDAFKNRILYYESSRGCPYTCGYCLSGNDEGVRFLALSTVFRHMDYFLKQKVKQVKFADRTFNCNKKRTKEIWEYLIANDNSVTNFHFEIAADLLDQQLLDVLKKARNGLFQFEIGIQSTNTQVLDTVRRKSDLPKLFEAVKMIHNLGNIHIHLDLIAGLPGEDAASFKKSFNDVYSLKPQQLQLGFLKLLKGSYLRANAHNLGIVYDSEPPYTVLYTKDMSFSHLQALKYIEELVELYYNSQKAVHTICFAISYFDTTFDFYEKLSEYCLQKDFFSVSHGVLELYTVLYDFLADKVPTDILKELLVFDMLKLDNIKTFPYFTSDESIGFQKLLPKENRRLCRLWRFEYDVLSFAKGTGELLPKQTYVKFDYSGGHYGTHTTYIELFV